MTTCPTCGQPIPGTPFCAHCGNPAPTPVGTAPHPTAPHPTAPAPPVAPPPPPPAAPPPLAAQPSAVRLAVPVRRGEWAALALVGLAQLTWSDEAPLVSWLGFPVLAAALAAWTAYHLRPALLARVPRWPADRTLELVAGLLLFSAVLRAGLYLGFLLQVAAVVVLARTLPPAAPGTRLVDVARLWRAGWPPRVVAGGLLLCGLALAAEWNGAFTSTSTYTAGDWVYTNTYTSGADNAWDLGYATWLALFLAVAALALVVPRWWSGRRTGPLVLVVALALAWVRTTWLLVADWRYVDELQSYGGYPQFEAFGPVLFLGLLVPTSVAAGWLWLRPGRDGATGGGYQG